MNISLKYLIIGDAGVGKTSFTNQFTKEIFEDAEHIPTCGCEFQSKTIVRTSVNYKIQMWDTAGQEEYQAVTKSFYRNVACCIFAFDLTSPASFGNLKKWHEISEEFDHPFLVKILIGTKQDVLEKNSDINAVSHEEIENFQQMNDFLTYYETSSKEGKNVEIVFEKSLDKIIDNMNSAEFDVNECMYYGIRIAQPQNYFPFSVIENSGRLSALNNITPKEELTDKNGMLGCTNGCCQ